MISEIGWYSTRHICRCICLTFLAGKVLDIPNWYVKWN